MGRRKVILGIILILSLAVLAFFYFFRNEKSDYELVEVLVRKGVFEVVVTTTGELRAENSQNIYGPEGLREAGIWRVKISDLVPEGTLVAEGDYVATIDRTEVTTKLTELREQVQKAQTQLDKTRLDTAMTLRSARDNLVNLKYAMEESQIMLEQSKFESPATIRQATISLDKAERAYSQAVDNYLLTVEKNVALILESTVNLKQADRKFQQLADLVEKFRINAPKPGMVIYSRDWNGSKRKVGAEISPWDNVIATLPDLTSMVSRTFVNEIDISKVKVGQVVNLGVDAFPGKKFRGEVIEVANIGEELANSSAKVFEVMVKIFGTDTILRPAMTTSNSILTATFPDVLSLPLEAIRSNDSLTYVFKRVNGSLTRQIIEPGQANETEIIILNGLAENDPVLLTTPPDADQLPFSGLDIWARLKVRRQAPQAETSKSTTATP